MLNSQPTRPAVQFPTNIWNGMLLLGRYCSEGCWREEATKARARISVDPWETSEDDDDTESNQSE